VDLPYAMGCCELAGFWTELGFAKVNDALSRPLGYNPEGRGDVGSSRGSPTWVGTVRRILRTDTISRGRRPRDGGGDTCTGQG
jgi:hypothetical protein